ncbi:MAG: hypothetical protein Q9187_006806 [Circinaria calcarea]
MGNKRRNQCPESIAEHARELRSETSRLLQYKSHSAAFHATTIEWSQIEGYLKSVGDLVNKVIAQPSLEDVMAKLDGIAQTTEAVKLHVTAARKHSVEAPGNLECQRRLGSRDWPHGSIKVEGSNKRIKLENPNEDMDPDGCVDDFIKSEGKVEEEEDWSGKVEYMSPAPSDLSSDTQVMKDECDCYRCYHTGFAVPTFPPTEATWCAREQYWFEMVEAGTVHASGCHESENSEIENNESENNESEAEQSGDEDSDYQSEGESQTSE